MLNWEGCHYDLIRRAQTGELAVRPEHALQNPPRAGRMRQWRGTAAWSWSLVAAAGRHRGAGASRQLWEDMEGSAGGVPCGGQCLLQLRKSLG